MSWNTLLELIADEIGMDAARKVEERARLELGGMRITVSIRPWVSPAMVERAAPGRPQQAARKLGISPSTAYRMLKRRQLVIR